MSKITSQMSITEAVMNFPETAQVFTKFGMHCLGCAAARFENIEQGARAHGIDVEPLITALNKALEGGEEGE